MLYQLLFLITVPFLKQRQQRPRKSILKQYALVCAGLVCFPGVQAQNINYVDARFSVEYNNQPTQGESRLKIRRNHNKYEVDFKLDHWLLTANQKATFEMDQCRIQPLSYTATNKRPFKSETIQTITFDWEHKKAEYNSENGQKLFDLDTPLYDPLSLFFEARCELMAGKKEFTYPLIHKGNRRTHTYKVMGTEIVETGQGQVEALIVERERTNKSRQTRLYVAPGLNYQLVKIAHQEGRLVNIVATLESIDYELADD